MNSQKYQEVLEKKLKPTFKDYNIENRTHLDDSAPYHRTKGLRQCHEINSISRVDWPENSPDLKPIENLWSLLKFKLRRRIITSKRDLIEQTIKIWNEEIPNEIFKNLASSMKSGLEGVIKNRGDVTKY